jgi:polyphosphate kinase
MPNLSQAPLFEQMLVNAGVSLTKLWFSVSPAEESTRFALRPVDPVRQWNFSPMDIESVNRWQDYTVAKEEMFDATDTDTAPWIVVKSNDKKRARINAMRHLLAKSDYDDKDHELVGEPDPLNVGRTLAD